VIIVSPISVKGYWGLFYAYFGISESFVFIEKWNEVLTAYLPVSNSTYGKVSWSGCG
jgi:hypothetical protein